MSWGLARKAFAAGQDALCVVAITRHRNCDPFSLTQIRPERPIMQPDIAETLVEDFERGLLSRRQLASRLMGLGAALAVMPGACRGRPGRRQHLPGHGAGSRRPERQERAPVPRLLHQAPGAEGHPGRRRGQLLPRRRRRLLPDAVPGRPARPEPLLLRHQGLRCRSGRGEAEGRRAEAPPGGERVYFPDLDGIEVQVAGS